MVKGSGMNAVEKAAAEKDAVNAASLKSEEIGAFAAGLEAQVRQIAAEMTKRAVEMKAIAKAAAKATDKKSPDDKKDE